MIISYKWLQNMVDTNGIDAATAAAKLTARGLEVEGFTPDPTYIKDIIVARLIHIAEHPNSDHLHLVDADAGTGELIRVVCGAPGIQEGWLVPFAPVGAQIGDLKIKVSKLRGETSNGMLCSEKELGLGSDNATLLRLSPEAIPGMTLAEALKLGVPESVAPYATDLFEIGLTPDRGDCLSHWGIARELSASLQRAPRTLQLHPLTDIPAASIVTLESPDDCPRYLGVLADGIKVGPSPAWLRRAVESCGARSVNNVVDVTNFVCFELGHPMHAFDRDKLKTDTILVRRAHDGESIDAINHEKYTLNQEDVVITDGENPVAIAGVMGGLNTEVDEHTTRVLFEFAAFHPTRVRKTAKRLGLHSESSHRYERFVDPEGIERAAQRTLWLLNQTLDTPARFAGIDDQYPRRTLPVQLTLRRARVAQILGKSFSGPELEALLKPIGFVSTQWNADDIPLSVPTWRSDITREIDVIEEICRGYGFDNFPAALPDVALKCPHIPRDTPLNPTPYPIAPPIWERRPRARLHDLRDALIHTGLDEAMHYTFMDPGAPAKLNFPPNAPESNPMKIANPMSVEHSTMRTTMLPGMIDALLKNIANQQKSCALFEVGEVFTPQTIQNIPCLTERRKLAVLLWGEPAKPWFEPARAWDVYDLKGCLQTALYAIGATPEFQTPDSPVPWLHDGIQAAIALDGKTLGFLGELHPLAAANFKIEGPVFLAELDLDPILDATAPITRMSPLPRFHFSTRDLSIVVPVDVTFQDIARAIQDFRPDTLESWSIFDVYKGKQILPGLQSISLNFRYRHPDAANPDEGRPLSDDEVNAAHAVIVDALNQRLGAYIR